MAVAFKGNVSSYPSAPSQNITFIFWCDAKTKPKIYFSSNCIIRVCCGFGSLTCHRSNGKAKNIKSHVYFPLVFFRLWDYRDTHEICMISSLAFTVYKWKGRESKLTCYFRIHKSLLVRWMCIFFFVFNSCIWKTLAIAFQTFSNDFMLRVHVLRINDSQTHTDRFVKIQNQQHRVSRAASA